MISNISVFCLSLRLIYPVYAIVFHSIDGWWLIFWPVVHCRVWAECWPHDTCCYVWAQNWSDPRPNLAPVTTVMCHFISNVWCQQHRSKKKISQFFRVYWWTSAIRWFAWSELMMSRKKSSSFIMKHFLQGRNCMICPKVGHKILLIEQHFRLWSC